ncbi:MAG: response regulator [Prevotella sp.]|nr:response regulator [Prevotella sp.]
MSLFFTHPAFCQSARYFTADQGLSSSLIYNIYCDHNGIIWIATEDGLNRYDGVKLTVYRNYPDDEHSLAHNYVRVLFEDKDGHFFVGTYKGIQLYDPAADNFSPPAKFRDSGDYENNITGIAQRKNGELWVSGNTVCRLDITKDGLFFEKLNIPIPTEFVENILVDRDDNVWITKEGDGVYMLSTNGKVKHFPISKDLPFFPFLRQDKVGNIFAGSLHNGMFFFDRKQSKFFPISVDKRQNFSVSAIYPIDTLIYIGTDGNGLKIFNIKTHQLSDYVFEENNFATNNSKVHAICRDNTGNYWLGIYQKGVLMLPPQRNGFKYWGSKSALKNIIGDYCVTALYRDDKGTTYVGTDNDGIYIIDNKGNRQAHYTHTSPNSAPSIIMSVFEDSEHNIWLGSYSDGAAWLDPTTGKCTYIDDILDSNGKKARNVYAFAEDNNKRVWIATMGAGLFCYDLNTKQISRFPEENNWIDCLYYSPKKNSLFVGTYSGMCRIDLNNKVPKPQYVLQESIVYSIYEHSDGHIWAGSSEGLLEWDTKTDSIQRYTTDDGLCNDFVYAIQGGNDGYLWISTSSGISCFQPATGKFTNYYVGDGLQGNEFSKNSSWRDKQGMLWFGGINGVTFFNPKEITVANRKWHVRITDFYLFGKPVRKGMKSGNREIVDCPVFEADNFYLSHSDNAFTIEFSTVELDNTDRIIYEYSMNDNHWISLQHGIKRVTFGNLSPGTYHFRLRAKDGLYVSDTKMVTIHIAQPWWNSWWAWVLYIIAVIIIALIIAHQVRLRYLARKERERLMRAEQLGEAKLQLFINISHEIRTPMTLIISPLRELIKHDADEKRQRLYRTIYRNANRILNLINQLMDIRKIDKGQMHLHFMEENIIELIDDLYDTFADVAKRKKIKFSFLHDGIDSLPLWIDPDNFDKIILNILSNAFKFTPAGGSIQIDLQVKNNPKVDGPLSHTAEISVTDSGIGIDTSELERIFDRFYQTRNNLNYKGTGVGLHLTRSLVLLHHGTIFAENRTDGENGSRFVVRLPLGNAHLSEDEIVKGDASSTQKTAHTAIDVLYPETDDSSENNRSKQRVLIVEDDEEIRNYLRQELSDKYRIEVSANGKKALEQIFQREPDLIISDVMMPEMDGLTLCRKIKQNVHLNHIPVVLLTAKVSEEDNIEGLDIGADAYITKPFNIEVLRHTMKNLLRSREQLRNIYSGGQQSGAEKLEKIEAQSPDDRLMERIMKVVNAHISDPDLTVEMIASEIGISRVHLHRKLKELTNQTTRNFLSNVRMKQAATLLAEKRHSISEVAELVGYSNLSTFSSSFKALYGMSPSEYREQHSNKENDQPS